MGSRKAGGVGDQEMEMEMEMEIKRRTVDRQSSLGGWHLNELNFELLLEQIDRMGTPAAEMMGGCIFRGPQSLIASAIKCVIK